MVIFASPADGIAYRISPLTDAVKVAHVVPGFSLTTSIPEPKLLPEISNAKKNLWTDKDPAGRWGSSLAPMRQPSL
jgi:hypothetical protein